MFETGAAASRGNCQRSYWTPACNEKSELSARLVLALTSRSHPPSRKL